VKRSWAVRPDETGTVSREALIGALVDGATMLDLAGGVLEVVVGRAPTDVPGEMVMTGALLQWKDRTDAKPQPEATVAVTPQPKPAPEPQPLTADEYDALGRQAAEERDEIAAAERPDDVDPADGFDYSKLEEEDVDEPVTAGR
jgi:hypothetical protein